RRQGDGGAGAGASAGAAARAVGLAGGPCRCGHGNPQSGPDPDSSRTMSARSTPFAFAVATLMRWALFLGLLVDRAELFVAAIPLAIGLLSGGSQSRPPRFALRQEISASRLSEGDRVLVTVAVSATDPLPIVEVLVKLPPMLELDSGSNRVVLGIEAGREAEWSFSVLCPARGRFDLGTIHVRLWDRSGMAVFEDRQA